MIYQKREKAPALNNAFYYSNQNIYYKSGYGMPNCTAYALGRYAEISGKWLPCRNNAETWFDVAVKNGLRTGKTPQLGAVICWSVGAKGFKDGGDGAGHVAIVEEILSNGNIVCSGSAYKGNTFTYTIYFANKNYEWSNSKTGYKYKFEGFIYQPNFYREPKYLIRTTAQAPLHLSGSQDSKVLTKLPKATCIRYDGVYHVSNGVKWKHVYPVTEGTHKAGWVSDKLVQDVIAIVDVPIDTTYVEKKESEVKE